MRGSSKAARAPVARNSSPVSAKVARRVNKAATVAPSRGASERAAAVIELSRP